MADELGQMNSVTLHVPVKSSCPLTSSPHPQLSSIIHPLRLLLQRLCCRSKLHGFLLLFSGGFVIVLGGVSTVGDHLSLKLGAERWRWCKRGGKLKQPATRHTELVPAKSVITIWFNILHWSPLCKSYEKRIWFTRMYVLTCFSLISGMRKKVFLQLWLCLWCASLRDSVLLLRELLNAWRRLLLHFDCALFWQACGSDSLYVG